MTLGTPPSLIRSTRRKRDVLSGFMRRVGITDFLVIIWAVVGAQLIRFGTSGSEATSPTGGRTTLPDLKYTTFSVGLIIAWLLMLRLQRAYDRRLVGHGPEEYRAVAAASFQLFAVIAITSYVLRLELARGYVAIALPAGMLGLLLSRWIWRKWLTMHRAHGQMSDAVLVVGGHAHLVNLIRALGSVPSAGYRVVAACCSDADHPDIDGVPVVGDESDAAEIAGRIARDGAVWVVHPRGKADVADTVIFVAAKATGLTYTKVVRFSETDTAEKLVIPVSSR